MRFFFISLIVGLFTAAVWPWVKQFLLYLKAQYEEATKFEQESVEDASPEKIEANNVSPIHAKKEPENDKTD